MIQPRGDPTIVEKFNQPYDTLIKSIEKKRAETKLSSRKG